MEMVLWVGCGFICYCLARSKGKSPGWGFVGGLLWGVFGVIYYLACEEKK